ncbi:hypothetical protein [Dactylosporangium sp. NPDC050588]|uniref:hypothetical protein n=1 Tax=Dactylosporangium sp. NPDC050588 TaxID=3157211 RepID=UPI0033CBB721
MNRPHHTTRAASGRGWAYLGVILGGSVSVAANIAHSFITPPGKSADWTPEPGAVVGAIVWPVFLFVAVEILARVAWKSGLRWMLLRFGGLLPVVAVAALVSYRHLSGLLAHYGEEDLVVWLGPLAVDGLMVMATGALLATSNTVPATAVTPTEQPSEPTTEPTVHAVPVAVPVTALDRPTPMELSSEDRSREAPTTEPRPATVAEPAVPPTPADLAIRITRPSHPAAPRGSAAASGPAAPDLPHRSTRPTSPASQLAPSATDSVTAPDAAQLPHLPLLDPALIERGRQIAEQYGTEHGTPITVGQLAVRLQVPSDTASQVLTAVTGTKPNPATVNGHRPARATR